MRTILCKNIIALYRYRDFRVGIFYFASPCSVVGFNVLIDTLYRSFWGRKGSRDPTSSVIAQKGNGQSTRSRANPTRLSSPIGKKDVKIFLLYI